MSRPHVVILGAGFGGMYAAKKLLPQVRRGVIRLTIVNRTNYFLFTPLLHEVATGSLSPRSVAEPLREVFAGEQVRIIEGEVTAVNAKARTVSVTHLQGGTTLAYDYLIIASGAETNYYNIPGAAEFTLPLKTLMDAAVIRSRVIDAFEQAMLTEDANEHKRLLSFTVVGGGATGVEIAAELAEFVHGMVKRYYCDTNCLPGQKGANGEQAIKNECEPEKTSISLIHTGNELLEMFAPSLRQAAARRLEKNGVTLHMKTAVTAVSKEGLTLSDFPLQPGAPSRILPSATIIWAAGVKASVLSFTGPAPALSGGRFIVDEFFRLQGETRIFAMGDVAAYVDVHDFIRDSKNSKALPMLAQVAVAESKTIAANVLLSVAEKPLRRFHYHSQGSMVSVGQWFAIGEIFSQKIAGRLTWWIWRTAYLLKFASWKKRVRIVLDWTLDMFYPRDITKLT